MSVSEQITVVIPTSPIPSHPSTAIIEKAIASLRTQLPNSIIIISCDGIDEPNAAYCEYVAKIGRPTAAHGPRIHQSGMLKYNLKAVNTPLLLYWEHDWELLPDIPWQELSALILSGEFNYIKLHAQPRISPYHEHLMEKRVIYQDGEMCDRYLDNRPGEAIPLVLTRQWSQNPHLASTQFYRDKILPLCEGKCDFIENLAHGIVAHSPWEEFRCAIYNPAQGDMMRCRHLDGKNSQ